MNKKSFSVISKAGALLLWIVAIYLFASFNNWLLLALVALIHLVEIPLAGIRAGKEAGHSVLYSSIMTFIFGFTWWKFLD